MPLAPAASQVWLPTMRSRTHRLRVVRRRFVRRRSVRRRTVRLLLPLLQRVRRLLETFACSSEKMLSNAVSFLRSCRRSACRVDDEWDQTHPPLQQLQPVVDLLVRGVAWRVRGPDLAFNAGPAFGSPMRTLRTIIPAIIGVV